MSYRLSNGDWTRFAGHSDVRLEGALRPEIAADTADTGAPDSVRGTPPQPDTGERCTRKRMAR